MDDFRDVVITGEPDRLEDFVTAIEQALDDGWYRDVAMERRPPAPLEGRFDRYFSCSEKGRRRASMVNIAERKPGVLYVPNVVLHDDTPGDRKSEEYNYVLVEFYMRFVRPCAERLGLTAEMTDSHATLDHFMSEGTAERLQRFSTSANKATGSSHPSDQELWFSFVVASHRERSTLDTGTFRRWMVEDGWTAEAADRLALEYEYAMSLLRFVDEEGR